MDQHSRGGRVAPCRKKSSGVARGCTALVSKTVVGQGAESETLGLRSIVVGTVKEGWNGALGQ
jgi:hypothetical protein